MVEILVLIIACGHINMLNFTSKNRIVSLKFMMLISHYTRPASCIPVPFMLSCQAKTSEYLDYMYVNL